MTRVEADQAQGAPVVSITRTLSLEIENECDPDNTPSVEFIMDDTIDNRCALDAIKRAISNASKFGLTISTGEESITVNTSTELDATGWVMAQYSNGTQYGYQLRGEWYTPFAVLPELAWDDDNEQL